MRETEDQASGQALLCHPRHATDHSRPCFLQCPLIFLPRVGEVQEKECESVFKANIPAKNSMVHHSSWPCASFCAATNPAQATPPPIIKTRSVLLYCEDSGWVGACQCAAPVSTCVTLSYGDLRVWAGSAQNSLLHSWCPQRPGSEFAPF